MRTGNYKRRSTVERGINRLMRSVLPYLSNPRTNSKRQWNRSANKWRRKRVKWRANYSRNKVVEQRISRTLRCDSQDMSNLRTR